MTLYEINKQIMDAVEYGCDSETGEIIDASALDTLKIARDEKHENTALLIKDLRAQEKAIAEEEAALHKRRTTLANKAGSLAEYLQWSLDGEMLTTPRCAVQYRRTQVVNITDETLIPDKFFKIERKPSKQAIKDALKHGEEVAGAVLQDNRCMIIK